MKVYRKGFREGIIVSVIFYVFILDIILETLADLELIGPLKEYTYNDIAYERDKYYVYGQGLDSDLGLEQMPIGRYNRHVPIASIYRNEPVLDITPEHIKEICVASADYDQFTNPLWEVAIRFNDENLLTNLARQNAGDDTTSKETFSLFRIGGDAEVLQMGRFSTETKNNYSAKQEKPNHGDMHIFFGDKDFANIVHNLILLSPTHKILPCSNNIDMRLYETYADWQPLPSNFTP